MKFFNLDLHISVIQDIKQIFSKLGHEVINWSLSSHNWVFDVPSKDVDVINQENWRMLDQSMCDSFYNRYKHELNEYDGFIVTHTPSFSLLYEKFDKPIIVVSSTRYEAPFSDDSAKWLWLNDYLKKKIDENIIIPVANNKYDSEYCKYFTFRIWDHIPNICDYTLTSWAPKRDTFLVAARFDNINFNSKLISYKSQMGRYKWSDISEFQGIIVFPYNCSTMSIFEYYAANIPLFFPSYEFLIELYTSFKRKGILSELSWNQVQQIKSGSVIEPGLRDPNNYEDLQNVKLWIKLADFYDDEWMPHLTYFNSFDDLFLKLKETDLTRISKKMKEFNRFKKARILNKWSEKLLDHEKSYSAKKVFNQINPTNHARK